MANLPETHQLDEAVFDFVRKTEESALEAGRRWAKTIGDFVPVEMPAVREMVKGVFDFTEDVLKIEREFAHDMLKSTHSVLLTKAEPSPRPTAGTPRAAHAHRATPRARAGRQTP